MPQGSALARAIAQLEELSVRPKRKAKGKKGDEPAEARDRAGNRAGFHGGAHPFGDSADGRGQRCEAVAIRHVAARVCFSFFSEGARAATGRYGANANVIHPSTAISPFCRAHASFTSARSSPFSAYVRVTSPVSVSTSPGHACAFHRSRVVRTFSGPSHPAACAAIAPAWNIPTASGAWYPASFATVSS